jgi:hypothetical protein
MNTITATIIPPASWRDNDNPNSLTEPRNQHAQKTSKTTVPILSLIGATVLGCGVFYAPTTTVLCMLEFAAVSKGPP